MCEGRATGCCRERAEQSLLYGPDERSACGPGAERALLHGQETMKSSSDSRSKRRGRRRDSLARDRKLLLAALRVWELKNPRRG